jgi:acetyl-CoA carboxylase biotin carboxylase subunit
VGGIKTNLSLFRRILADADFCAAKLDTGFLDRMLKQKDGQLDSQAAQVAAIAAGIFAVLGVSAAAPGERAGDTSAEKAVIASNWKSAGRREALR